MKFIRLDFDPPPRAVRLATAGLAISAAVLLAGMVIAPQRAWANVLMLLYFVLCLGLAGAVFVAIQYVTGAGWSVALRRVPEAMSAVIPIAGILLVLVLLLRPSLYAWFGSHALHEFPPFKQAWLSRPFFLVRAAVFVALWSVFAALLTRNSRRQDSDGDVAHTRRNVALSAAFIVVFALTFWLASYDWVMSLEPEWYSTIFGIYNFAGLFVSGLAAMLVLLIWLSGRDPFRHVLSSSHLHDLGTLLFAFSTFWMYIWFSQYMLIWYANIPEETGYFVARLQGAWKPLFLVNMLLNWAIPFGVLLHRGAKRSPYVLLRVAAVILVGRWLDLYLMFMPSLAGGRPPFGLWEVAAVVCGASLFVLGFFHGARRAALIPIRDPYLVESTHALEAHG